MDVLYYFFYYFYAFLYLEMEKIQYIVAPCHKNNKLADYDHLAGKYRF